MRHATHPLLLMTVLAQLLAACAVPPPADDAVSRTPPAGADGATPRPTVDANVVADQATFGGWRRRPVSPSPRIAAAAEAACRARDGVGTLPLRLVDARGEGVLTLVFADDAVTTVCHVTVRDDGSATADTRSVGGLADARPPADGHLGAYDLERLDTDAGARLVIVGRVADVPEVSVSFDDATWARATMAGGWYTAWWSQAALALVVASVDRRNVVIDSVALTP